MPCASLLLGCDHHYGCDDNDDTSLWRQQTSRYSFRRTCHHGDRVALIGTVSEKTIVRRDRCVAGEAGVRAAAAAVLGRRRAPLHQTRKTTFI